MKTLFLFLSFLGLTLNSFAQYYNSFNELPRNERAKYAYKYSTYAHYDPKKFIMNEDVFWMDSSYVYLQADITESERSNYYIGALPLAINGKVTKKPTPLAKSIAQYLSDKEFCNYISSLTRDDITQLSIFWIHIKGNLDIPVDLWNILHPEDRRYNGTYLGDRFDTPKFNKFNMAMVRYKEKIGDGYYFLLSTGESWGIIYFDDYDSLVRLGDTNTYFDNWHTKEIDKPVIDGWFNMLPFPAFPQEVKEKILPIIKRKEFRQSRDFSGEFFYY